MMYARFYAFACTATALAALMLSAHVAPLQAADTTPRKPVTAPNKGTKVRPASKPAPSDAQQGDLFAGGEVYIAPNPQHVFQATPGPFPTAGYTPSHAVQPIFGPLDGYAVRAQQSVVHHRKSVFHDARSLTPGTSADRRGYSPSPQAAGSSRFSNGRISLPLQTVSTNIAKVGGLTVTSDPQVTTHTIRSTSPATPSTPLAGYTPYTSNPTPYMPDTKSTPGSAYTPYTKYKVVQPNGSKTSSVPSSPPVRVAAPAPKRARR